MSIDEAKGSGRSLKDTTLDAARYLPVRGVHAVASMVTVVVLARLIAVAEYGTFVVLLVWSALLSACVFNWVTAAAFRFYEEARSRGELPRLYRELAFCYLMMAGIWITVGGAVIGFVLTGLIKVSIAAILWLVLLGLLEAVVTMYQNVKMASRQVQSAAVLTVADSLLRCIFGIAGAVLFDDRVAGVLAGQCVASALVVCVLAFHVRARITLGWGRVNRERVWAFISYGYPMAGMTISSWVLSVSDRLLLSWMLGASAVGVYSAGYQLGSNSILFPSSSLMAGAFPVLIQEYERGGQAEAAQLLTKLVTGVLIVGCALVIFLSIASHPLVKVLLGDPYSSAAAVIPVVALGQLLMALSEYFAKSFQLTKQTSDLFLITLIAACVNVLANLVLVPWIGIMGAAAATVLAYAVSLGITASHGRKLLAVGLPFGSLWRVVLTSVGTCLVLFWLQRGLGMAPVIAGLLGLFGVALFSTTLWATREPTVVAVANLIFGAQKREVKD